MPDDLAIAYQSADVGERAARYLLYQQTDQSKAPLKPDERLLTGLALLVEPPFEEGLQLIELDAEQ